MKTILFYTSFLVCSFGSLFACYSSHDGPTDSNTNWLGACEEDSDCKGSDVCICGVCTTYCTSTDECKQYHEDAVCIGLDREKAAQLCEDINLDGPISFCALGCETDRDCIALGKDLSCIAGFCVANGEGVSDNRDNFVSASITRLGQQGDPCSDSAPCEEPLVCGYSETCELHQVVSHANSQIVAMAANEQYIYWDEWDISAMLENIINSRQDTVNNNSSFAELDLLKTTLARAPIEGGPRQRIDDELAWPVTLTVDDDYIYYGHAFYGQAYVDGSTGEPSSYTLRRYPHSSTISEFETSGAEIHEDLLGADGIDKANYVPIVARIVHDSTHLFVVHLDGRLIAIDKSSGDSEQVAQLWRHVAVIPDVALDQDCLYVCTSHIDTEDTVLPYDLDVRCYDRQNWQETVIVNLGDDIRGSYCRLEMIDDYLIVQSGQSPEVESIIVIDKESGETQTRPLADQRTPSAATPGTTIYSFFPLVNPSGTFQAHGEHIYWIAVIPDDPLQYLIHRTHLQSGQTETMLKMSGSIIDIENSAVISTYAGDRGQLFPPIFLVTDEAIFWQDPKNDNAIMRLELP